MINDSGNRTKFESGAVRDIQEGKGRCDLLPLSVIGCWCEDSAYGVLGCIDLYRLRPSTEGMSAILNKFADNHRNTIDTCKSLERYRYDLVLEVAKHFEEGAKKYGDRNWEKGIPCDRYIDSAVRHYCKWRAGWDDEPHDRAFIWNVVCCEWTRQQYGWDLERLGDLADKLTRNGIMSSNEFRQILGLVPSKDPETAKKYENVLGMKTELLDTPWKCERNFTYPRLMSGSLASVASSFHNKKRFTRSACLYLYDRYGQPAGRVWILNAYKSANLYAVIGNVWKESNDVTLKILEAELSKHGWKPGVDFVVEAFDDESKSKTFEEIGKKCSEALKDCEEINNRSVKDSGNKWNFYNSDGMLVFHRLSNDGEEINNPCIKDTDTGWHFYDIDGKLVAYIFDFKEPEEGKRRQLGRMLHKVWREVTGNPYTIKRIVEERGYICGRDFSICIAPSEIAKEYDFKNRKYNEED